MITLAALEKRLARLEKNHCSTVLSMPDGARIVFNATRRKAAFNDALYGHDTPDVRILLNAVSDSDNEGRMRGLLKAVLFPEATAEPVPSRPEQKPTGPDFYSIMNAVRAAESRVSTAQVALIHAREQRQALTQGSLVLGGNILQQVEVRIAELQDAFEQATRQLNAAYKTRDEFNSARMKEAHNCHEQKHSRKDR